MPSKPTELYDAMLDEGHSPEQARRVLRRLALNVGLAPDAARMAVSRAIKASRHDKAGIPATAPTVNAG